MRAAAIALGLLCAAPACAGDLAIGDSIALGVGRALHVSTIAREREGSCWISAHAPAGHFGRVVISAGVNDAPGRCVPVLRDRIDADRVVWILPVNAASAIVEATAAAHGDLVISYVAGRDHLHPASYEALARSVRAAWR